MFHNFFKDNIQQDVLQTQLVNFGMEFRKAHEDEAHVDIFDIRDYFHSLTSAHRLLFSQICVLVQLILVMPATNVTSVRSFSALCRVMTSLRNTMTQQRLNNLMVLHVHKDITDRQNLTDIASEFISDNEHRLRVFVSFA